RRSRPGDGRAPPPHHRAERPHPLSRHRRRKLQRPARRRAAVSKIAPVAAFPPHLTLPPARSALRRVPPSPPHWGGKGRVRWGARSLTREEENPTHVQDRALPVVRR